MNVLSTVMNAATGQLLEGVSPEKLAEGLTHNPLAWTTVICLLMLIATNVFWVKIALASYDARVALMEKMFDVLLKQNTGTVTLGLEFTKGLDVMDKVVDQYTRREND